jgi:hypothetical protein
MSTSIDKLNSSLDFLASTFDFDREAVQEAPNGDRYIEFSISTDNFWENRLECTVLNTLNRAVDPDANGIDTGPTSGKIDLPTPSSTINRPKTLT